MEIPELQKAEKFFKQIVDKKVEEYINTSQKVADSYVKQKQQAQSNSLRSYEFLQEIKRQVGVLKSIQSMKIQVPGTSLQDVKQLILKYEKIIQNYESQLKFQPRLQRQQMKQIRPQIKQAEQIPTFFSQIRSNTEEDELISSQQNFNRVQKDKKSQQLKRKILILSLKSMEMIMIIVMIAVIVKFLFFV